MALSLENGDVRKPPEIVGCRRQDESMHEDSDRCYRAVASRDARFDG